MPGLAALELSQIPMSQALATTLARAFEGVRATGSSELTLEHLLAALCDDPDAGDVLAASRIDAASLRAEVIGFLARQNTSARPIADANLSDSVRRILEAAAAAARGGRRRDINGAIVLAAIVGDGRSPAAQMLQARGLTFDGAIRALQAAMAQTREPSFPGAPAEDVLARARERVQSRSAPSLREIMREMPRAAPPPAMPPQSPADINPSAAVAGASPWERSTVPPVAVPLPEPPAGVDAPQPAPDCDTPPDVPGNKSFQSAERAPGRSADSGPKPEATVPEVPNLSTDSLAQEKSRSESSGQQPPSGPVPVHAENNPEAAPTPTQFGPAPQSTEPSERAARPSEGDHGIAPNSVEAAKPLPAPTAPPASQPAVAPAEPSRYGQLPPPVPPPIPKGVQAAQPHGTAPMIRAPAPGAFPPPRAPQGSAVGAPMTPPMSFPPGPPIGQPGGLPMPPPPGASGRMAPPMPSPMAKSPSMSMPPSGVAPQGGGRPRTRTEKAELGQLAENIPRTMREGVSERVEVRIARGRIKALTEGLEGGGLAWRHEVTVTKAMAVRLRAPEGGFFIETASPETQWIGSQFADVADEYAGWRFIVTPNRRGRSRLQIIVSARTVGSDGLAAETAFPDQVIEVKVRANMKRALMRAAGWIAAAVAGSALAKFGEGLFAAGAAAVAKLIG